MTEYTSNQRETRPIDVDLQNGPTFDIPKSSAVIDSYAVGTARADVSAIMSYDALASVDASIDKEPVALAHQQLIQLHQARLDALAA